MPLPADELKAALEAVIFVSSEPLTPKALRELFPDEAPEDLERALEALERTHAEPGRGLVLARVAGGYRITTRPEVHPHVERFIQRERAERLSLRTLETLSVIAYKQPVTAAEVAEIRGVDPAGTLKTLLDKGLIKVAGRKKVVGRPFVYATTQSFLTTFGLDDLAELPSLKELAELGIDLETTAPTDVDGVEPLDPSEAPSLELGTAEVDSADAAADQAPGPEADAPGEGPPA